MKQRREADHRGLTRHQLAQRGGEMDGLVGQLTSQRALPGRRVVALVEQEVDRGEDAPQATRQLSCGRYFVRDRGCEIVGEVRDGQEAVYLARRRRPDVALMDIRMPGKNGLQATRELAGPDVTNPTAVLILTTFDLDEYVVDALRAGASGFLLKDAGAEQMVDAVRTVARGDALIAPSVTCRLLSRFIDRAPSPLPASASELTSRELDVIDRISRGDSNAELARALGISETTAKSHVARVLAKLGLRDRVQIAIFAYRHGLEHQESRC